MSAQSQLGIKVKARFVRALRKGIYSIPPFMCTAVCIYCFPLLFYPSSPPICLSPFFEIWVGLASLFSPTIQLKVIEVMWFYFKPIVKKTQITVWFWGLYDIQACLSLCPNGLGFVASQGLCLCDIEWTFLMFLPKRYPPPRGVISTAQAP